MAVVYVEFERARNRKTRSASRAIDPRSRSAQGDRGRKLFWACLALAPLAGLAAPIWAVPRLGAPYGWALAGAGLLACLLMLFRLAMHEADRSFDQT